MPPVKPPSFTSSSSVRSSPPSPPSVSRPPTLLYTTSLILSYFYSPSLSSLPSTTTTAITVPPSCMDNVSPSFSDFHHLQYGALSRSTIILAPELLLFIYVHPSTCPFFSQPLVCLLFSCTTLLKRDQKGRKKRAVHHPFVVLFESVLRHHCYVYYSNGFFIVVSSYFIWLDRNRFKGLFGDDDISKGRDAIRIPRCSPCFLFLFYSTRFLPVITLVHMTR